MLNAFNVDALAEEARGLWLAIHEGNIETAAKVVDGDIEYDALKTAKTEAEKLEFLNTLCIQGVSFTLKLLGNRELENKHEDAFQDAYLSMRYFLQNICFSPNYRNLHVGINLRFNDGIIDSDIPERTVGWSTLDLANRESLIVDVVNNLLAAAEANSNIFAGMRAHNGVVTPNLNKVGIEFCEHSLEEDDDVYQDISGQALGDHSIKIIKEALMQDTPDEALKTCIHETLHILDSRLKSRMSIEFSNDATVLQMMDAIKRHNLDTYKRFAYDHCPTEKHDDENVLFDILAHAAQSRAQSRRGFWRIIPRWG